MDRLSAMQVFAAVVEARGFSAASRLLGIPVATVSRKISELENTLGAQLLVRSTRRVTVTDSGQLYYENVLKILEEIASAERLASGEYQQVKGILTITAPALFGRLHVLPIVNDFMRLHSDIEIRLLFTNHVLDLPDERIDLGVRIGETLAGSLLEKEAGSVRQIVCASPGFLKSFGRPAAPAELAALPCVSISRTGSHYPWCFRSPSGKPREVAVNAKLLLNSIEGAVDSALQGIGLSQLYSYQASSFVAAGDLEIVLEEFEIEPPPVRLVFPEGQRLPQKVRAFTDFALPRLKHRLAGVAEMCAKAAVRQAG